MVYLIKRVWHVPRAEWLVVCAILLGGFDAGCSHNDSDLSNSSNNEYRQNNRKEQEIRFQPAPTASGDTTDTSKGSAAGVAKDLSGTLPDGVRDYPGAVRVESLRLDSKGNEVKAPQDVFMFLSPDPDVKKVARWYQSELESAGWTLAERNVGYNLFQRGKREMSVSVDPIPEPKPDGHADAQTLIVIDAN